MSNLNRLYASLTGPLIGLYMPAPKGVTDKQAFRTILANSPLRRLWCSVYTRENILISDESAILLPERCATALVHELDVETLQAVGLD